ncbi:hypothetical protein DICPUDRAFT_4927, partial [Dictyostelium purpureum]
VEVESKATPTSTSAPSSPSLKSDTTATTAQPVQSSINYHHNAKLIQVTGPEEPYHYISVPLSVDRLNLEDAFIMQSDAYMFVWYSDKVASQKKAKAIQMAQKLKIEIGCQRTVQALEFGEEHLTFLFCLGLPKGEKLNVKKEENDIFQKDEDDELLLPEFFLYKLSTGADGKPSIKPIEEEEIKQEMLESNACFILDCEHEMYIWQGKDVKNKSTKEALIPLAKKIWEQYDRPEYYSKNTHPPITIVYDGAEGCLFKSKFSKWVDKAPVLTSYLSLQKKKEAISFEVSSMHEEKPVAEIHLGSDYSKGKLFVWSCLSNGKWNKVEEDDFGIFYSNKSYICHFIYKPEGKSSIRSAIFYWEGLYANARNYISYKFGLFKEIQKKMQSLQSDDPVEYRIAQNKEPKEFINLFGTELLVLNEELSMKPMIFQVRGNRGTQLYPEPNGCNAKLLNSLDSFVFLFPEKYIIVWHGKATTEDERTLAADLFTFLPPEYEADVKEFDEGSEDDSFWELIGGSSSDITHNDTDGAKPAKLKLFLCTENSGIFKADQICPFSQIDLNNEEAVILDAFTKVFVWKGSKCSDSKYKETIALAKEYIESANDERPSTSDDIIQEEQSQSESQLFKSYFHSWKVTVPKVFVDPLIAYKQKQKEKQEREEKERKEKEAKEKEEKEKEEPNLVATKEEPIKAEEKEEPLTSATEETTSVKEEEPVKVDEVTTEEEPVKEMVDATPTDEITKVEEEQIITATTEETKKEPVDEIEEEQVVPELSNNKEETIDEANTADTVNNNVIITESPEFQPLSSSQDVIPTPIKEKRKSNEPTAPSSIGSSGDLFFNYQQFPSQSSPKMNRKGGNKKKHNKKNHSVGSMSPATSPTNYPKSLKNDIVNQTFDLDSISNNTSEASSSTSGSPLPQQQLNPDSLSSSPLSSSTSIAPPSGTINSGQSTPKKNKKNKKKQHNRSNS